MWFVIVKLVLAVASYFWDVGVDILVGKEQLGRVIALTNREDDTEYSTSGLNANSTTLDRLGYAFSTDFLEWNPFPVIHLCGTWQWIFAGCFFQFVIVCFRIRQQSYLSTSWKLFIILSSALMLGPTMVYFFCICLILSFKLHLYSALSTTTTTEQQITEIVDRALLFASVSKLGEIFFESIPQILTQLLMTSANGNDGVKELSLLQMASVATSVVTIASTISSYAIEKRGNFMSKKHSEMATRLVMILFIVTEIAFCGGIARFSSAFGLIKGGFAHVGVIACMMPFILLSSIFAILPTINDKFLTKRSEFIFIAHKLIIWISVIVIFFFLGDDLSWDAKASKQNRIALETNNCFATFVLTMSIFAAMNFMLGAFLMRLQADFQLYAWMDRIVHYIAWLLTKIAWLFTATASLLNKIADEIKKKSEAESAEEEEEEQEEEEGLEMSAFNDTVTIEEESEVKRSPRESLEVARALPARPQPEEEEEEEQEEEDGLQMSAFIDTVAIEEEAEVGRSPRKSLEVARALPAIPEPEEEEEEEEEEEQEDVSELHRERGKGRKKGKLEAGKSSVSESSFQKPFCPLFIFCLLLGALAAIFFRPVNYDHGYHVEFHSDCFNDRGFPLVSATENSKKGTICNDDFDALPNAIVAARQLGLFSDPDSTNQSCSENTTMEYNTLLLGALEYAGEKTDDRKTPLLSPYCEGTEDNLMKCGSTGLGNVDSFCGAQTRTNLYIAVVRQKIKMGEWREAKGRREEEVNGPNVMYRIYNDAVTFSNAKRRNIIGAEDTAKISYQLKTINFGKIWLSDGRIFDVESGKVTERRDVPRGEKLPFVCKVPLGKDLRPRIYKKPTCGRSAKIPRGANSSRLSPNLRSIVSLSPLSRP